MACFHPIYAVRLENGQVRLGYEARNARHRLDLPCGWCLGCRKRRALEYSMRAQLESKLWPASRMLTLTYDDAHLPPGGGLVRKHYTDFAKRLRRADLGLAECSWKPGLRPLRVLACGEYGSVSHRPHFHAVVLNLRLEDELSRGVRSFTSERLSSMWPHGFVQVDEVTPASIAYVSGYVRKKLQPRRRGQRFHERVDDSTGEVLRLPLEFVQTPQKPGLGLPWLERFRGDVSKQFVVIDGRKRPIPRYFLKKLEADLDFQTRRDEFLIDVISRASMDERPPAAVRAAAELIAMRSDKSRRDGI